MAAETVTARKRAEREMDVPVSVTVLTGDRLSVSPVQSNADLARSVPNFSFVDIGGQAANSANIRGVGSFNPLSADDTSVVFYIDEMPLSVYGVAPNLMDTERVEVLRGPQGTLFGRNTQGGAVSIVSRKPTFDNEVSVAGEAGTSGYRFGQLVANSPLVDRQLAGRLALSYSSFAGDIPNIVIGGNDGAVQIGAARGTLLFAPSGATEALLSFNYNHQGDTSPRFLLRDAPNFPVSAVNPRTDIDSDAYGFNLRLQHAFDSVVLNSVTNVQRNKSSQLIDPVDGLVFSKLSGLPPAFFNAPGTDIADIGITENIYNQEVRLSSPTGSPVTWTAGVNAYRSELSADRNAHAATPAFFSTNGVQNNDFSTNSYAGFGEFTVPVIGRLKATFGLRASHEDKTAAYRFQGNRLPGVVPFFSQDARLSDDFLIGRGAISYDWTNSLMTYASISRGYVTAGFPTLSVNSPLGKPETDFPPSASWTYETGFKSKPFDDRVSLNGAVFFNDVKNGHLVAFNPATAFFTVTALDYTSYGGELETTARVLPGLDVFGGVGYTHARLGEVPAGNLTGAKTGNRVPNVPEVNGNVGLQAHIPGANFGVAGNLTGRLIYQFVGSRAVDVANSFELRPYSVVNAKLGWEHGGYSVYVFSNNLFDVRYETWGQSFGPTVQTVRVGQGRIVGLGATAKF